MSTVLVPTLLEKYIRLRDKKGEIKERHKAELEQIDNALEKAEAALLQIMNAQGLDSMKCATGTAYKSRKTGYRVADWDSALDFIRRNELWNMLERRVAKTAVEEFRAAHNDLPPGLDAYEEISVNIRRA